MYIKGFSVSAFLSQLLTHIRKLSTWSLFASVSEEKFVLQKQKFWVYSSIDSVYSVASARNGETQSLEKEDRRSEKLGKKEDHWITPLDNGWIRDSSPHLSLICGNHRDRVTTHRLILSVIFQVRSSRIWFSLFFFLYLINPTVDNILLLSNNKFELQ